MTNSSPRRVSNLENDETDGLALCHETLFHEKIDQAKELRRRQAAYLASLPTDPKDCISAALRKLHPFETEYVTGFEEAMYLGFAVDAMVTQACIDDEGPWRDAARYLCSEMITASIKAKAELDDISDILTNAKKQQ